MCATRARLLGSLTYSTTFDGCLISISLSELSRLIDFAPSNLKPTGWAECLTLHPDREKVRRTIDGILLGEPLGFKGERFVFAAKNPRWNRRARRAVARNLQKRLQKREVLGPFQSAPTDGFRSSRMHVVPKDKTDFRIVHDLSFPPGLSVNDGICMDSFLCEYELLDRAIDLLLETGRHTRMMRYDWKSAFKQIVCRPEDWELSGFSVDKQFYVDTRLPFGARSSPAIFNRYSELFQWILQNVYGVRWTCHYADDHLFFSPDFSRCPTGQTPRELHEKIKAAAERLGIVLADDKQLGPSCVMMYLGIELDSIKMEARVSQERIDDLLCRVRDMQGKTTVSTREISKLLGHMNFVCKVVPPSRAFMSRLIDPLRGFKNDSPRVITLSRDNKLDLLWWSNFLPQFNGISLFRERTWATAVDLNVEVDASGYGAGGFREKEWFVLPWDPEMSVANIALREMIALVLACNTWGPRWARKKIMFWSDNSAVVAAVSKRRVRYGPLNAWIRELFLLEAVHSFEIRAQHIPGVQNVLADHLSRNRIPEFKHAFFERFGSEPDESGKCVQMPYVDRS